MAPRWYGASAGRTAECVGVGAVTNGERTKGGSCRPSSSPSRAYLPAQAQVPEAQLVPQVQTVQVQLVQVHMGLPQEQVAFSAAFSWLFMTSRFLLLFDATKVTGHRSRS